MKDIENYFCPFCKSKFKQCTSFYHGSRVEVYCYCKFKNKKYYSYYDCQFPKLVISDYYPNNYFKIQIYFDLELTLISSLSNEKPIIKLNKIINMSLIDSIPKIKSLINNKIFI